MKIIRRRESDHSSADWKAVRIAVEQALPFYEGISEIISMFLAGPLRRRAIRRLEKGKRDWILDSGSGPGVSSRLMIESGFEKIVGLDPSIILLRSAKKRLGQNFYPVLGAAENLPFRDKCIAGEITCFSLRDVRDTAGSVAEFARVIETNGRFLIVDVGKPDDPFLRRLIGLYVALAMPVAARFFIGRRGRINPFKLIIPTFYRLSTNRSLERLVRRKFGNSTLREFLFGGLIIIEASRVSSA